MTQVVGVRWRTADPISFADAGDYELHRNNYVVLTTQKGQEFGWVVKEPRNLVMSQPDGEVLLTVLRKGTASDFGRWQQIREMEEDAFRLSRAKVRELHLAMKIAETHYTFDRSRIIVTYSAEGRVDFRPLLRELGTALRSRVEMKQVGDRNVAKLAGGIGKCGRVLCCTSWMTKFDSIGIRMAKEQALPISADGLSGACGRLRCCLRFEYEQYREINRSLPRIGEEIDTPNGLATVIVGHRLKETVSVRYSDDEVLEWSLVDVTRN